MYKLWPKQIRANTQYMHAQHKHIHRAKVVTTMSRLTQVGWTIKCIYHTACISSFCFGFWGMFPYIIHWKWAKSRVPRGKNIWFPDGRTWLLSRAKNLAPFVKIAEKHKDVTIHLKMKSDQALQFLLLVNKIRKYPQTETFPKSRWWRPL